MNIIGIAGYSGSGKTTLVVRLIPEIRRRGLTVSTVKHTHHNVSIDKKGSLTRLLRDAGAIDVVVAAEDHWALLHEHRGAPEPSLEDLARRMKPVDILLVEGFKTHSHDKIEVHRPAAGKPLLYTGDPYIIAIATDGVLSDTALPQLDLNNVSEICDFIIERM
jgi:molybdopterin-guanine dinucleotide biosynthesis protein B